MSGTIVMAKAKSLLPLALDANGVVDASKLQAVTREILQSSYSSKREIVRQLAVLAEKLQLQQLAEVTSAVELSKATQDSLATIIKRRHPEVKQFNWDVNPTLLGGFTIRVADTWYDTTVNADLEAIREQLSR